MPCRPSQPAATNAGIEAIPQQVSGRAGVRSGTDPSSTTVTLPTMVAADEDPPERTLPLYWLVALYLAALAVNVYVFWVLPTASLLERLAFALALIGIYNLALSFLRATDFSKTFSSWLDQMTSADLRDFAAATMRTLAVVASLASLAVRGFPPPLVMRRLPLVLQVLAVVVLGLTFAILNVVLFLLVVVVFVLGIAPIAYIGYVLVDVYLDAVSNSPNEIQLSSVEGSLGLKETVRRHRVDLRTLLVGVPAIALGVATQGYALLT
jgi:hypothetical protein